MRSLHCILNSLFIGKLLGFSLILALFTSAG